MTRMAGAMLLSLLMGVAAVAQETAPRPSADEVSVIAIASGFVDAWNRHDAKALADLYAQDADFVNVIGLWWHSRAEIQKEHEALHATRMKDSHLTALETAVRFLRPDVAIVHERWELTGDTGLEGKPLPTREGILTHVIVKSGDRWTVVSSQNTDIVPLPNIPVAR